MSALPGRLRAVVCGGMEQVQAVLVEAQRAQAAAPSTKLNVLGARTLASPNTIPACLASAIWQATKSPLSNCFVRPKLVRVACSHVARSWRGDLPLKSPEMCTGTVAAALRGAFFDSFATYAVATDRLSQELSAKAPAEEGDENAPDTGEDGLMSGNRKLLVLLSNCAFVRGSVMPSLIDRCVATRRAPAGVLPCASAECLSATPAGHWSMHNCRAVKSAEALSVCCRFNGLLAADNRKQEVLSLAQECSEDIKQVPQLSQ